jgi:hypothetical protein
MGREWIKATHSIQRHNRPVSSSVKRQRGKPTQIRSEIDSNVTALQTRDFFALVHADLRLQVW